MISLHSLLKMKIEKAKFKFEVRVPSLALFVSKNETKGGAPELESRAGL